jgi:hypothetical protein
MIPDCWTELAASEWPAELRRKAKQKHQCRIRPGRPDGKARRLGSVHRHGRMGITRPGDQS